MSLLFIKLAQKYKGCGMILHDHGSRKSFVEYQGSKRLVFSGHTIFKQEHWFFFSAEAEDSYFSIDFRLKIFNIIHNLTVYTNF